jgi:two-component system, OmpR family, response regulator
MTAPELRTILFIEDDPDILTVATMALEAVGGFQVLACSSGRAAIERVAAFAPDLILLDVMMPSMDGPATLAELRRMPAAADVPVVFMTAKVQAREVAHYRELGALDVIAKPFDPMTLSETVRSIWRALYDASPTVADRREERR